MKRKKKLVIGAIALLFVLVFFLLSMNTYTSSPGYTNQEFREEFFATRPTCHGISILLNEKATWADAPGRSLCIGYLEHNDTLVTSPEDELTPENLAVLQKQLDQRNKTKSFPIYPNEHIPTVVGTYKGISVEEQYWCSDACPDNGILFLNLVSSTEETCEDFGGNKLYKWGWGHRYVGCSPTENKYSD